MSGIYIHIPFCRQACSYCDFYFVTRTSERGAFVEQLINEIGSYAGSRYTEEPVQTVYFGGGTPSLLNSTQLGRILEVLEHTFRLELQEVTMEINPDDVTADYLHSIRDIGINRASMGIQTFKPELLAFMNRTHSREEALYCLELLSRSGFETFTVDLIYGNPGQSLEDLEADIKHLLVFDPPHISAYSLTVEANTRLGKQVQLGRIIPPEDNVVADHFDLVGRRLMEHGIHRYEVSNYSKPGFEAVHNSNYWRHKNYLGMGPGAHSFWWDASEAVRWTNEGDLKAYMATDAGGISGKPEELTLDQLAEERIMLGLRTRPGIHLAELADRYDYLLSNRQHEYLEKKRREGKIKHDGADISLTDTGIKIADAITLDFITLY